MPNLERIALWQAALRSGEYEQAQHALRGADSANKHKFCCLGVACDVYRKETGLGNWEQETNFRVVGGASWSAIPKPVAEWYGFEVCGYGLEGSWVGAFIKDDGMVRSLQGMNDAGVDFAEIADVLDHPEVFAG